LLRYVSFDTTASSISAKGGQVAARPISVGSTYTVFANSDKSDYYEVLQEPVPRESSTHEQFDCPELQLLAAKLFKGRELNEQDRGWLKEISEVTGWELNDVIDELKNIDRDPAERAEKYYRLYIEYLEKAREFYRYKDFRQAGEKLYAAVLALIKYYAAIKHLPIMHWSRGKIEKFITSNVEPGLKKKFRDLLDKAQPLHEHFYEGHLDDQTFRERWNETLDLLEKTSKLIGCA